MQIKRGTNAQRLVYTPAEGELVFVTDYVSAGVDPLWIGDNTTLGGNTVSASGDGITDVESDTTPTLGGDLSLGGYEINGAGDIDITGTISSSGAVTAPSFVGDLTGSVFADDSTLIIDGVNGSISTNIINPSTNVLTIGNNDAAATENQLKIPAIDERGLINIVRTSASDLTGLDTLAYGTIAFGRDDANGPLSTGIILGRENALYFGVATDGDFSTADKFFVFESGKLGIKNTAPTVELDVVGDAAISGSLTAASIVSDLTGSVFADDSSLIINGQTGDISTNILVAGAIQLSGSNIDTDDSSAITIVPGVTFNSDVDVENNMTVRNTLTVDTLEVTNFQTVGSGTLELESDTNLLLTAGTRVEITSSPLKMASFTTTERNALTPENGDIIYNTTDNKFQGYENGAWANLI